jgi:hypothetical protein
MAQQRADELASGPIDPAPGPTVATPGTVPGEHQSHDTPVTPAVLRSRQGAAAAHGQGHGGGDPAK